MAIDKPGLKISTLPAGSLGPQGICFTFMEWSQLATNWINTLRFWVEKMTLGDREARGQCLAVYGRRSRGFDPVIELGDREPGSEYEPFMAEINFYTQLIEKMRLADLASDATFISPDLEDETEPLLVAGSPAEKRIRYLEAGLSRIATGDDETYGETNPSGYLAWAKRFALETLAGEWTV